MTRDRILPQEPRPPAWWREAFHRFNARLARSHRRTSRPTDLLAWAAEHLPDHFRRRSSTMHRWLAERLDAMTRRRGVKVNLLGPRGGAKSTIGTLAFPLYAALELREPYVWIVSDTRRQAEAHLENLKSELLDNPRLADAYPESVGLGPVWRSNAIVLRNGTTVEAFGTGQRIRGRRRRAERPTLIVCDDLQNDDHMISAVRRERSRAWFHGTLLKAGTVRTNIVNLATALHRDALAMELGRTPGWISRVFRSIETWPTHMELWAEWERLYVDRGDEDAPVSARRFYETHREAMDAGAEVLWPEEEDLYALMCMRVESGPTTFEREKQNSPIAPESCEWPDEYFDESIWFGAWPDDLVVKTLALDPSKGTDSRRGDYSAFVRLGADRRGLLYVEADLARRPVPQITADGVDHCLQFRPDVFGVEANQFQELLADAFAEEFLRRGRLGVRPQAITNRVNKLVRIRRLGPYLSGRRFRMKSGSPSTRLLVEQLRQFPAADHDDGPDALEMAVRLADAMLRGLPDDGLGTRLIF